MVSKEEIDRNINHLYSMSEFIRDNEEIAAAPNTPPETKANFIRTLLAYEDIRKHTVSLLESYFKQEGSVVDFNYRKLYSRLSEE